MRVAVISGRRRRDLVRLVRVRGVTCFGASGADVPRAYARRVSRVPAFARRHARLCDALRAWCEAHPPAWLEDKGAVVEVHLGALAGAARARVLAGVRRRLRPHAGALAVTRLSRGLEIGARGRSDKGTALSAWHARGARGALLLFAGDDANDRPAFAATRRRGGFAIVVGNATTGARAHACLADPREVGEFLRRLARAWRDTRASSRTRSPRRRPDGERMQVR